MTPSVACGPRSKWCRQSRRYALRSRSSVRIGLATGPVVVGEASRDGKAEAGLAVGETPNLAARLQALAGPGEVVIAHTTRRLLGDAFSLTDLGTHPLKESHNRPGVASG